MRLALAQINTVVGDLDGNRGLILARLEEAREAGAELVLFPELAVTGYPPEDLLLRPAFVRAARRSLEEIAAATPDGVTALIGVPWLDGALYNACAVCTGGEVTAVYRKQLLPNYGVFDEKRYFEPGDDARDAADRRLARRRDGVRGHVAAGAAGRGAGQMGVQLIVNLSASPFHVGKDREREAIFAERARETSALVALVNAVGGQDELVFDGHSVVLGPDGEALARAPGFEEALLVVDVDLAAGRAVGPIAPLVDDLEQMRLALELGLRDYVDKNGFRDIVVGLSGGIDSALTAALAVEALGAERVHGVSMPSRFSSEGTRGDAARLAESLGIDFREIPIESIVGGSRARWRRASATAPRDLTEENLQAACRGTLLMALSNKFGWLVVATGNKSELSVGYATLYGDMAGGFALLKDVFKTDVFRLARHLNDRAGRELIPRDDHRPRADAPSCARTSRTRIRSRPTTSSTGCSRRTSSSTAPARSCSPTASTPGSSTARSR